MSGASFGGSRFTDLYVDYAPAVHRYVRTRLRDPHLVDDTVQETFVRVYRFLDRLDPDRPAWPWIKAIADTMCRNAVRGTRHRVELLAGDDQPVVDHRRRPEPGPEEHCVHAEQRHEVVAVLDRLPTRHRTLLVLKEVHELSLAEIAVVDGSSPVTVKAVLARARAAFRRVHAETASGVVPGAGVLRRVLSRLRRTAASPIPSSVAGLVGERLAPSFLALVVAAVVPMSDAASSTPTTVLPVLVAATMPTPPQTTATTTTAAAATIESDAPPAVLASASTPPSPTSGSSIGVSVGHGPATAGLDTEPSLDDGDELSVGAELWSRLDEDEPYAGVDATVQCDGSVRQEACDVVRSAPSPQP